MLKTNPLYISNGIDSIYRGTIIHAGIATEYDIENPILVFPSGDIKYYETDCF